MNEIAQEFKPEYTYLPLTPEKLFEAGWEQAFNEQQIVSVRAYLAQFAEPVYQDGKRRCLYCASQLDGMMHALGRGAAFVWGLAYGEASCSKCGAPSRGHHYVYAADGSELFTLENMYLEYMPKPAKEQANAEGKD